MKTFFHWFYIGGFLSEQSTGTDMRTLEICYTDKRNNYRAFKVINSIGSVGILVHLVLIPVFYWLDFANLSLLNIASSLIWISAWLANRQDQQSLASVLMTFEVIIHTAIVVPIVGWHAGFQYYLFAAIPFTLLNNRIDSKSIVAISILLCLEFLVLLFYTHDRPSHPWLSHELIQMLGLINSGISFAGQCIIIYYFCLASIFLENELEKQAYTDPLTGLYNRRRMSDFLAQQGSQALLEKSEFSVIFADIDHFKKINDTYGHDTGDQILSAIAAFIKRHLRKGDTLARWGGEEFLILLPHTDMDGARVLAEKIRNAVAEQRFQIGDREFAITLTFGLCQHQSGRTIEESVRFADIALYQGKEAGRNRVMCYY
jgi:diguanylate cyclase (GGDEF)-like protein